MGVQIVAFISTFYIYPVHAHHGKPEKQLEKYIYFKYHVLFNIVKNKSDQ